MYSHHYVSNPLVVSSPVVASPHEPSQEFINKSREFANIIQRTSQKLTIMETQKKTTPQKPEYNPNAERRLHPATQEHIQKANVKLSEFLHLLANEPSIGLTHVCDHIARSIPKLVECKKKLRNTTKDVEKFNYDLDSTLKTIKSLKGIILGDFYSVFSFFSSQFCWVSFYF